MSPRSVSVHVILGLSLLCMPPVTAQLRKQGPGQEGPLKAPTQPIGPPELLPDLVVASAVVTMKCQADGTRSATIVATVKNQSAKGTADLSKVPWQIIVEADWGWGSGGLKPPTVKPQAGGPKTLKSGESWKATLTIAGIKPPTQQTPGSGPAVESYNIQVIADPLKGVVESNENNNDKVEHVNLDKDCLQIK